MSGEFSVTQALLHMPLTLALPASCVMQASPDVPATLVGVSEGVAVGVGDASITLAGVAVGVGVGVGVAVAAPTPEPLSSWATLVAIATICFLRSGISATCVSSAVSLFITSLDAARVAVGVGVATSVASGTLVEVGVGAACWFGA